ncbi:MAG: 30S ribosomal protein S6 [Chloroflexaceae bacterium]|nr:30S ribosomal protein S6 [Chloroflexaceae bacterium]
MSERIRSYELMFIISPLHSNEDEVASILERITGVIEGENGEVTAINHRPPWGRRKLAYPIRAYAGGEASRRSFTEGFYILMHFMLSATGVAALERTIKLTDPILRHLITIVDKKNLDAPAQDIDAGTDDKAEPDEDDADVPDDELDDYDTEDDGTYDDEYNEDDTSR